MKFVRGLDCDESVLLEYIHQFKFNVKIFYTKKEIDWIKNTFSVGKDCYCSYNKFDGQPGMFYLLLDDRAYTYNIGPINYISFKNEEDMILFLLSR